jgi:hypothetical protein
MELGIRVFNSNVDKAEGVPKSISFPPQFIAKLPQASTASRGIA